MESCRPRKLEPGLKAVYSIPRAFRRSTMTSEPYWACEIQGESDMGCSVKGLCENVEWHDFTLSTALMQTPLIHFTTSGMGGCADRPGACRENSPSCHGHPPRQPSA